MDLLPSRPHAPKVQLDFIKCIGIEYIETHGEMSSPKRIIKKAILVKEYMRLKCKRDFDFSEY